MVFAGEEPGTAAKTTSILKKQIKQSHNTFFLLSLDADWDIIEIVFINFSIIYKEDEGYGFG